MSSSEHTDVPAEDLRLVIDSQASALEARKVALDQALERQEELRARLTLTESLYEVNEHLLQRLDELETQLRDRDETIVALGEALQLDPVTGISNKAAYDRARLSADQDDRREFTYIDFSGFKEVNDTHGHDLGDENIQDFTRVMKEVASEHGGTDKNCFRLGGDEFVILTLKGNATHIKRKLIQRFRARRKGKVAVQLDIGVGPTHQSAEKAMYRWKRQRKAAAA